MESKSLENRVTALERDVETLRGLPDRIATLEERLLQFQLEVRGEFSAVRHEMHRLAETLRMEIRAGDSETRRYMRVLHEEVLSRIANIHRR
jgi:hypothetical protein